MTNEGEYRDILNTDSDSIIISTDNTATGSRWDTPTYTIDPKYYEYGNDPNSYDWKEFRGSVMKTINKKGDDENMRYLYEVILINPKNDNFVVKHIVAKTETSAMMQAYDENEFSDVNINFDDLKTSCRVLMEWKKKESLKKAIETIKKAVE